MEDKYYECETFKEIIMRDATLSDCIFEECVFMDCIVETCQFSNCRFLNCEFVRCSVSDIKSEETSISHGIFKDCHLNGVDWNTLLPTGLLAEPINKVTRCELKYNVFKELNFKKFNFSGCTIIGSIFAECNLEQSEFKGCNLKETEFYQCDLRKTDFREAIGYQIDLITNKMKGSKFSAPEAVRLLGSLGIKVEA